MTGEWPVKGKLNPPSGARRQAEALHAAGVPVEIFAFHRGRNPYGYLAAWTQLRPRLHRGRYDVVHAQSPDTVLLALPKRVPLVVTVDTGVVRRMMQLLARFLARRADAVIVGSEEMRRHLWTRAPVHVIPPDTDEQTMTARLLHVYRSVLPSPS
jgi:hypothetical protein